MTREKDVSKIFDRTNAVYEFDCEQCNSVYIGETKRALKRCKGEHKNNKNPDAVINIHYNKNDHSFDWENPRILDTEHIWNKRLISEMLCIKSNKNSINKKENVSKLSNVYVTGHVRSAVRPKSA